MTVGMFDSAVVSAPANLSAGVHIPSDPTDRNGWVVYEDGTAQQIGPTFPDPKTFIEVGTKFEGVAKVEQNIDGTFMMDFEGRALVVKPRFGTTVRDLKRGESTEPSVALNADGTITFSVVVDGVSSSSSKLRGSARKKTETNADVDEP
jgi:hypothetical protein